MRRARRRCRRRGRAAQLRSPPRAVLRTSGQRRSLQRHTGGFVDETFRRWCCGAGRRSGVQLQQDTSFCSLLSARQQDVRQRLQNQQSESLHVAKERQRGSRSPLASPANVVNGHWCCTACRYGGCRGFTGGALSPSSITLHNSVCETHCACGNRRFSRVAPHAQTPRFELCQ